MQSGKVAQVEGRHKEASIRRQDTGVSLMWSAAGQKRSSVCVCECDEE